jgi:hypothetical protein
MYGHYVHQAVLSLHYHGTDCVHGMSVHYCLIECTLLFDERKLCKNYDKKMKKKTHSKIFGVCIHVCIQAVFNHFIIIPLPDLYYCFYLIFNLPSQVYFNHCTNPCATTITIDLSFDELNKTGSTKRLINY